MFKKDNRFLLVFSFIVMIGLMLALTPISDFDQDGAFDSLVTEGLLLLPLISFVTGYVRQVQFPVVRLADPHIFFRTFHPPPIST